MFIGISGKMGSGKDTVANHLIKSLIQMKKPVVICRFADRLKYVTAALTATSLYDQYSREGKQLVPAGFSDSLGTLQQKVGMAFREHFHPDIWIHAALGPWLDKPEMVIIIPDLRFQNEARFLKERNAVLIRLEGDPVKARANDARDLNHISETDLDSYKDWTAIVANDGSLEQLFEKIDKIVF